MPHASPLSNNVSSPRRAPFRTLQARWSEAPAPWWAEKRCLMEPRDGFRPIEQKALIVDAFDCMKGFKSVIGSAHSRFLFLKTCPTGCGVRSCVTAVRLRDLVRSDEWRQLDGRCEDACHCAKASAWRERAQSRRDPPESASIGRGNSAGRTGAHNIVVNTASG